MGKLRYSPEALADLEGILAYISADLDSPVAAQKTVRGILGRLSSLARFPYSGEALDGFVSVKTDYRRLVCGHYLAFYRVEKETVSVIRVIHGSRNYMKILFGEDIGS